MTQDDTWFETLIKTRSWPGILEALLDHDIYLIRPFSKIREHPYLIRVLELLRKDDEAVAILIGFLENFHVLGQWSLVLLPDLTGENPVPERYRNMDELFLELFCWTRWAERNNITPIL